MHVHVLVLGALSSALASCALPAGRPVSAETLRDEPGWILLDAVPAVRQVSEQGCGAACLAMVLRHWDVDATAPALERECDVPGEDGIRAAALREAAQRRGLQAFLLSGTVADLEHELQAGRPVIVGLASPRGEQSLAHFQVVVGLQPDERRIAVLEPAVGHLLRADLADFEAEWAPTRRVMLVVFETEASATASDDSAGARPVPATAPGTVTSTGAGR